MMEAKRGMFADATGKSLFATFLLVSSLFFLWGTCNGMIDVMDKHFQDELNLTKSQSAWVQTAHYLGYLLMAMPAGWLALKLGYKKGIIAGLLLVAVGGFWFIPATHISSLASTGSVSGTTAFIGFLIGVCLIASGLTFLETIANPYTTVLGPEQYAATRINLAQSCNGIGWILGPILGGIFFYSKDASGQSSGSETLYIPYVIVAGVVLVLAVVFAFANIPDIKAPDDYHLDDEENAHTARHSIWRRPHFVMAIAAQFLYVAAQAGIFSFFINYMTSETPGVPSAWQDGWLRDYLEAGASGVTQISDKGAATLASAGFFLFLIGRFTGAGILRKYAAHKVLGVYAGLSALSCLVVCLKVGWLSVACVFICYFLMSIMFPTIFALGLHGLGAQAKKASAFLVMAIVGGAVLPKLMGYVADVYDMSRGFAIPLICFVFIALYGLLWSYMGATRQSASEWTRD